MRLVLLSLYQYLDIIIGILIDILISIVNSIVTMTMI